MTFQFHWITFHYLTLYYISFHYIQSIPSNIYIPSHYIHSIPSHSVRFHFIQSSIFIALHSFYYIQFTLNSLSAFIPLFLIHYIYSIIFITFHFIPFHFIPFHFVPFPSIPFHSRTLHVCYVT